MAKEGTISGQVGEVQATPTAYTLLRRLKDLLTGIVLAAGGNQIGARGKAGLLNSGVLSASAGIKGSPGAVYWLTVSDTAALAMNLEDSVAAGGTHLWGIDLPASGYAHFIFDPPIEFATGIYLVVSTATCKVTVGYI